jgi:putative flavoprotein involved in K+ transport
VSVRLPDFAFPHDDPTRFATAAEIVNFLDAFAASQRTDPLRCRGDAPDARRRRLQSPRPQTGIIEDQEMRWLRPGPYQRPLVPSACAIIRCFSSCERVPKFPINCRRRRCWWWAPALRAQIADGAHRAGRRCLLSVVQHTRMPRRYRGQDLTWWFGALVRTR